MIPPNQSIKCLLFMILAAPVLLGACAHVQEVRVDYRLLDASRALDGKTVFISFQDGRDDPDILGPGARQVFTVYSGNVALYVARGDEPPSLEGLKTPASLFREVFTRRVREMGGKVASQRQQADAELNVHLNTFLLDLVGRTWISRMSYDVLLIKDEHVRVRREISGEAERLRVMGLKQADQVMGDLFTDIVNRADLPLLFKEAGL